MQLKVNKELFNKKAEEKGLTQGQIAEKVGKKRNWVVTFLQSKNLNQIKSAMMICKLLGISINELIKDEQESNNNKK